VGHSFGNKAWDDYIKMLYKDQYDLEDFNRRFSAFVEEEKRLAGQYEENEFGPVTP